MAKSSTYKRVMRRIDGDRTNIKLSGTLERGDHSTENAAPQHTISYLPVRNGARVQAKLRVGATDDPLEKDADETASSVMRSAAPPQVSGSAAEGVTSVGSAPDAASFDVPETVDTDASVGRATGSGGRALDPATRVFMEERFGHDFSQVRVHDGDEADKSAAELQAQAYTVSNDIVFSKGAYDPHSDNGKWLLAHELTHVVQQGSAVPLDE